MIRYAIGRGRKEGREDSGWVGGKGMEERGESERKGGRERRDDDDEVEVTWVFGERERV